MISSPLGNTTLGSEVTTVTAQGFWLWVDDREYCVPFTDYPAFYTATVAQIFAVQRRGPNQFHWPAVDVDIELEALASPAHYPLMFKP